ncbi:MAG: hypothetical protein JSS66_08810 [Armatimonadetes bacterium]|nr:hypothetical protein [Armatimonadota bacterium]
MHRAVAVVLASLLGAVVATAQETDDFAPKRSAPKVTAQTSDWYAVMSYLQDQPWCESQVPQFSKGRATVIWILYDEMGRARRKLSDKLEALKKEINERPEQKYWIQKWLDNLRNEIENFEDLGDLAEPLARLSRVYAKDLEAVGLNAKEVAQFFDDMTARVTCQDWSFNRYFEEPPYRPDGSH